MAKNSGNVAEEAVAEESLPYKELLQQLYFNKIMEQLLHLVFMFTAPGNLVMDEFLCNSNAKATKSIAKPTNSIATGRILLQKR